MIIIGKAWGTTEQILFRPTFEIHRIVVESGGYCSVHRHRDKVNMFMVESGKLLIQVWKNDYDLTDLTELGSGKQTEVKAGEFHRFVNMGPSDVVAYEVYYPTQQRFLSTADIERIIPGGKRAIKDYTELPEPDLPK